MDAKHSNSVAVKSGCTMAPAGAAILSQLCELPKEQYMDYKTAGGPLPTSLINTRGLLGMTTSKLFMGPSFTAELRAKTQEKGVDIHAGVHGYNQLPAASFIDLTSANFKYVWYGRLTSLANAHLACAVRERKIDALRELLRLFALIASICYADLRGRIHAMDADADPERTLDTRPPHVAMFGINDFAHNLLPAVAASSKQNMKPPKPKRSRRALVKDAAEQVVAADPEYWFALVIAKEVKAKGDAKGTPAVIGFPPFTYRGTDEDIRRQIVEFPPSYQKLTDRVREICAKNYTSREASISAAIHLLTMWQALCHKIAAGYDMPVNAFTCLTCILWCAAIAVSPRDVVPLTELARPVAADMFNVFNSETKEATTIVSIIERQCQRDGNQWHELLNQHGCVNAVVDEQSSKAMFGQSGMSMRGKYTHIFAGSSYRVCRPVPSVNRGKGQRFRLPFHSLGLELVLKWISESPWPDNVEGDTEIKCLVKMIKRWSDATKVMMQPDLLVVHSAKLPPTPVLVSSPNGSNFAVHEAIDRSRCALLPLLGPMCLLDALLPPQQTKDRNEASQSQTRVVAIAQRTNKVRGRGADAKYVNTRTTLKNKKHAMIMHGGKTPDLQIAARFCDYRMSAYACHAGAASKETADHIGMCFHVPTDIDVRYSCFGSTVTDCSLVAGKYARALKDETMCTALIDYPAEVDSEFHTVVCRCAQEFTDHIDETLLKHQKALLDAAADVAHWTHRHRSANGVLVVSRHPLSVPGTLRYAMFCYMPRLTNETVFVVAAREMCDRREFVDQMLLTSLTHHGLHTSSISVGLGTMQLVVQPSGDYRLSTAFKCPPIDTATKQEIDEFYARTEHMPTQYVAMTVADIKLEKERYYSCMAWYLDHMPVQKTFYLTPPMDSRQMLDVLAKQRATFANAMCDNLTRAAADGCLTPIALQKLSVEDRAQALKDLKTTEEYITSSTSAGMPPVAPVAEAIRVAREAMGSTRIWPIRLGMQEECAIFTKLRAYANKNKDADALAHITACVVELCMEPGIVKHTCRYYEDCRQRVDTAINMLRIWCTGTGFPDPQLDEHTRSAFAAISANLAAHAVTWTNLVDRRVAAIDSQARRATQEREKVAKRRAPDPSGAIPMEIARTQGLQKDTLESRMFQPTHSRSTAQLRAAQQQAAHIQAARAQDLNRRHVLRVDASGSYVQVPVPLQQSLADLSNSISNAANR